MTKYSAGGASAGSAATISFSTASVTLAEGNFGTSTDFTFALARTGDLSGAADVSFSVAGYGAHPTEADDFVGGVMPTGTVHFAAGASTATLVVGVQGDDLLEPDEQFSVTLSSPSGATLGGTHTAIGLILNEDRSPPRDDTGGFPLPASIDGTQGADTLRGDASDNLITGLGGADTIQAAGGADLVSGNQGNDLIYGNAGNDTLYGGQGADYLSGGQGNDLLIGGLGDDTLNGGLGADRFVTGRDCGSDLIQGFSGAEGDRIDLDGQSYTLGSARDGSAVLHLSGGGSVTLAGVAAGAVNASFFG